MPVVNGEDAVRGYKKLPFIEDEEVREQMIKDLLEYCKFDTYAMVGLLDHLRSLFR